MEKYRQKFVSIFRDPAKRKAELAIFHSSCGRLGELVRLIEANNRAGAQDFLNEFHRELFCGVDFEQARFQALIDTMPE